MPSFNIQKVMHLLPHRFPFLMVDQVAEYEENNYIKAYKNVTVNEPQFTGHFPTRPIMPGVLILEAMAQVSGILTLLTHGETGSESNIFYFAGTDKVRFKKVVVPGDQLELYAKLVKIRQSIATFEAQAIVDDEVTCQAHIILTRGK